MRSVLELRPADAAAAAAAVSPTHADSAGAVGRSNQRYSFERLRTKHISSPGCRGCRWHTCYGSAHESAHGASAHHARIPNAILKGACRQCCSACGPTIALCLQRGRPTEQAAAGVRVDPDKAPRAREAAAAAAATAARAPKADPAAGTCQPGADGQGSCSAGQVRASTPMCPVSLAQCSQLVSPSNLRARQPPSQHRPNAGA